MPEGAAQRLLLGIAVDLDASGVARGVSLADSDLDRLEANARSRAARAERQFQRMTGNLTQAAGAAAVLGVSSAAAGEALRRGVVAPMLEQAEEFEVEFAQLQFTAQATGEDLVRLRDIALETGLATQFSPVQATEALRRLRASGLDTEEAIIALQATLDLSTASAGMLDLATSAATAGAAVKIFQSHGESARQVFDRFSEATRETNFQIEQLPVFMRSLRDMPVRFRATSAEIFALGGALRNLTLLPAQAGNAIAGLGRRLILVETQMRRFQGRTSRLRPAQRELIEAFQEMGVRLFDDEHRLRSMTDVFAELGDAVLRFSNDQDKLMHTQRLLGDQAGQVVTALGALEHQGLRGGAAFRALVSQLENSEGRAREAAATFENTTRGMRIFLEGTIQTIQILLGEMLAPVIRGLIFILRQISGVFLVLIRRSPTLARLLSFLALGFTVALLVGGAFLLVLAGIALFLVQLIPLITMGSAALAGLSAMFATLLPFIWPVVAVIGALIALFVEAILIVSALVAAYERNLGGLRDFINTWVSDLTLQWNALVEFFRFNSISVEIVNQLRDRNLLWGVLFIIGLARRLEEVWNGMLDIFRPVTAAIIWGFELIIEVVVFLIDLFEELIVAIGFKFSENMDLWRTFGQILGVIVVAGVLVLAAAFGLLTAAVIYFGISLLIALAPLIIGAIKIIAIGAAIVVGIMLIKWAIVALIDFLAPAFNWIVDLFSRFGAGLATFWARLTAADAPWRRHWRDLQLFIIEPGVNWIVSTFDKMVWWIAEKLDPLAQILIAVGTWLQTYLFGPIGSAISEQLPQFLADLGALWDSITSVFNSFLEQLPQFGRDIVNTLLGGLREEWGNLVTWFSENVAEVRDLLPSSDAVTGPFSDLTASGRALVSTFQQGAETAFPGLISSFENSLGGVLGTLGIGVTPEGEVGAGVAGASPFAGIMAALGDLVPGGEEAVSPLASRSVTITVGDINVSVQQATPEEAERLADIIIARIQELAEGETEATFA